MINFIIRYYETFIIMMMILMLVGYSLYIVIKDYIKHSRSVLSLSKPSDIVRVVYSEEKTHALVLYNHDKSDEEQLSWALRYSLNETSGFKKENVFFINIGTEIVSRRLLNFVYEDLKKDTYCILKSYHLHDNNISYLVIINDNGKSITFNTIIAE